MRRVARCGLMRLWLRWRGVSANRARKLLAKGWVTLNGRALKASDKGKTVTAADQIIVHADFDRVMPCPQGELEELACGSGWVAVAKPAGVAVHPLDAGETQTLLNAAVARYPQMVGVGREGALRSGVVHRLDVDTSGVMVLALDNDAWDRLREMFAKHQVSKTYHALVWGTPSDEGRADLHLAVTRHRPAKVSVVGADHPEARETGLSWRVVEQRGDVALIEVVLETGFLHQIRVACAHLGFPVLGDRLYGAGVRDLAPRHMLHAARLEWDGQCVVCSAPNDFEAVWDARA